MNSGEEKNTPEDNGEVNDSSEKLDIPTSSGRVRQLSESTEEKCEKRQKTGLPVSTADCTSNGSISNSPPKYIILEDVMNTAKEFGNLMLANEIALNADFKLEKREPPSNSLEKRITEVMHEAYWKIFDEGLKKDPPDYEQPLRILTEIKELLFSLLLPKQEKFRQNVDEVLDLELIKQQAEHNTLDLPYYGRYIASIMGKVCAPIRDENIKRIAECTDVLQMYRQIMETLELMKFDMMNFQIKAIRPGIVEYEKQQFKKYLDSLPGEQSEKLPITTKWLSKHVNPEKRDQNKSCILNDAFIELIQTVRSDTDLVPETVLPSCKRYCDIRLECDRLSIIASVILVTMSCVGSALRDIADFKKQLKEHVCTLIPKGVTHSDIAELLPNISAQVIKESNECLEQHGFKPLSKEVEDSLRGQISEITSPEHKIRNLASKRIYEFLLGSIAMDKSIKVQVPGGLTSLENELGELAKSFRELVIHNKMVHCEYYDDVLSSLLKA